MNELKFQAWSNKYKHMFRVNEISFCRNGDIHGTVDHESLDEYTPDFNHPYSWVGRVYFTKPVDGNSFSLTQDPDDEPFYLRQYTGVNDLENKEIYSGDIVEIETTDSIGSSTIIGEVKMYEGCWWVDNGETAAALWNEMHIPKILGNIYQNTELLEVQHDSK